MAKRTFSAFNWTPGTVADNTALAANTYMCLTGGSTTQYIDVLEIKVTGLAPSSSSPTALTLARASLAESAAGGSALANPGQADGPNNPATAALAAPAKTFVTASTSGPGRSNLTTDAKVDMGINAYGGLLRWNASPTQQFIVIGNATPGGYALLSNLAFATTPGLLSAHMIYEPA